MKAALLSVTPCRGQLRDRGTSAEHAEHPNRQNGDQGTDDLSPIITTGGRGRLVSLLMATAAGSWERAELSGKKAGGSTMFRAREGCASSSS